MSVVGCVSTRIDQYVWSALQALVPLHEELASWSFLPHSTYKHRVTQLSQFTPKQYSWVTGDRGV